MSSGLLESRLRFKIRAQGTALALPGLAIAPAAAQQCGPLRPQYCLLRPNLEKLNATAYSYSSQHSTHPTVRHGLCAWPNTPRVPRATR